MRRSVTVAVALLVGALPLSAQDVIIPASWARLLRDGRAHLGSVTRRRGRARAHLTHSRASATLPGGCRAGILAARALAPTRRIEGAFALEIRLGLLRHGERVIEDAVARCDGSGWDPDDDTEYWQSHRVYVVSAVGPWVTLLRESSDGSDQGGSYHSSGWRTFDLRGRGDASLTDVAAPRDLLRGLRRARMHDGGERFELPPRMRTWAEAEAALRSAGWRGSFAFLAWDARRRRAQLGLELEAGYCGLCPNDFGVLSVWAPPVPAARPFLEDAASGRGHLRGAGRVRVD